MDIVSVSLTIISIVVSVAVAVILAYLGMDRKLQKLLTRDYEGVLNRYQAEALLGMYLDEMKRELNREIDEYCERNRRPVNRCVNSI
jgi:uncharacterized protein YacL